MNAPLTADERRDRHAETLYPDGESWDFGQWLVQLVHHHLTVVEEIMGAALVQAPFCALLQEAMEITGDHHDSWHSILEACGAGIWENWEAGRDLEDASLYGRFGVTRKDIPVEERRAFLEGLVTRVEAFYARSDLDRIAGPDNEVAKTIRLARARWNLDNVEGDIDPVSLAHFGGVSEGRVRNMMTGADRVLENTGGKASAQSALSWLEGRSAFHASIWRFEEDFEPEDPGSDMIDAVVVPIAGDGSIFHPGLERAGHFTIGPKGRETQVPGFDAALRALLNMKEPRWRRPNTANNWGIVKAVGLTRIERSDLLAGKLPLG